MPRYDYKCEICEIVEEHNHSIKDCENIEMICHHCFTLMTRLISAPMVEGSHIYPVNLWNLRTPKDGPGYITVNSKFEHKKLLASRGFDCPSFHVGG